MLSILHTAQNQWLRQKVLDAHGNLLFCHDCFITTLDAHSKRHCETQTFAELVGHEVVHQVNCMHNHVIGNGK